MTGYFIFLGRTLPCYGVMIALGVLVSGAAGAVLGFSSRGIFLAKQVER